MLRRLAAPFLLLSALANGEEQQQQQQRTHNNKSPFPIHKHSPHTSSSSSLYQRYMDGCSKRFSRDECQSKEQERLEMNLRQPRSMVNYTSTGFAEMRAPEDVTRFLTQQWKQQQRMDDSKILEQWDVANIYANHWESNSYLVTDNNRPQQQQPNKKKQLRGNHHHNTPSKQEFLWKSIQPIVEEWTGMQLRPSGMYGIREYTKGAMMAPHVDRLPLVITAMIHVAHDKDGESWPLEFYGRNGHDDPVQVCTKKPGDMVLYEGHAVLHGRPYPLEGDSYANLYLHFEPTGRPFGMQLDVDGEKDDNDEEVGFLPPYLLKDSPEEVHWIRNNPLGWKLPNSAAAVMAKQRQHLHSHQDDGDDENQMPYAQMAAALGDLDSLKSLPESQRLQKDSNGWQPIHEAARAGHAHVLEYLISGGGNVLQAKTHHEETPLAVAIRYNQPKHVIALLTSRHDDDNS